LAATHAAFTVLSGDPDAGGVAAADAPRAALQEGECGLDETAIAITDVTGGGDGAGDDGDFAAADITVVVAPDHAPPARPTNEVE